MRDDIGDVKAFFSTNTYGYANVLDDYLETLVGEGKESGSLVDRTDNLTNLAYNIDEQIAKLERQVLSNRQKMIDSFVLMEQAQAKINQDMQFIQSRFASNNSK